jgi:dynein intermediate chain 1
MKPQPEGAMCLFSLKNPSFPEYVCIAETGVMCVDIHPVHPFLVCIGKYDGNVAVYDVQSPEKVPKYESNSVTNKHSGTVWQVILKQYSVSSLHAPSFLLLTVNLVQNT